MNQKYAVKTDTWETSVVRGNPTGSHRHFLTWPSMDRQFPSMEMKISTEAMRNFATHSDLPVEIKDPEQKDQIVETMIRDIIESFRIKTPAVIPRLVRKTRIETCTHHSVPY